jgi:hypothetical protein
VIGETELEGGKSTFVYKTTAQVGTKLAAAEKDYVDEYLQGLPKGFNVSLLKRVMEVSWSDG